MLTEFSFENLVIARLTLSGLLWLTYHQNSDHHSKIFYSVLFSTAKEKFRGIPFLITMLHISKVENIEYNERSYQIHFTTIFLVVDLVCKHDVLKMKKKDNGYYGCGLCTMRGFRRFPGSHSYPNNRTSTMRNPAEHEHVVRLFESGVVVERKGRKEKDLEVDTLGVKGSLKIFDIVPNLPLTCPIDTMHQCLKGVAHDVIKFFTEQLSSTEIAENDNTTSEVHLPNKFKRSIRSLRSLEQQKQT